MGYFARTRIESHCRMISNSSDAAERSSPDFYNSAYIFRHHQTLGEVLDAIYVSCRSSGDTVRTEL